jgi:propionate CoA-transferase
VQPERARTAQQVRDAWNDVPTRHRLALAWAACHHSPPKPKPNSMRSPARELTAAEAVALIPDGATVAVGGFVGAAHPELLTKALEERFLTTGTPRDLTLYYCAGQGDRESRGLNHLAHPGLVKRVIGGHWNLVPKLGRMALANEIEAYNLPQGVLSVLLRETAARRAGVFTKVGLHTFMDPRHSGGRLNARTTEPLVELIELDGEEWLRYRPIPIDVALIRASVADRRGNLCLACEGIIGDSLPMAQAAHNNGGIVIAQVQDIVGCLTDPQSVRIPGILVDAVVPSGGEGHDQTFAVEFDESFVTASLELAELPAMPPNARRLIGERALQEIPRGSIVNLGIGVPEAVAAVAAESGVLRHITLTVEAGPTGGVPAGGLSFGCSHHPEAIIDQPAQFDFYDGGGLDVAVLGAGEIDRQGNVNVASLEGRFAGVGGFTNISACARRVIFCCTFTAGGLAVEIAANGALKVQREGKHRKFVQQVSHICFHGPSALQRGQQVLYITERAVFELTAEGLRLIELRPGVDLQRDVLAQMDFAPIGALPKHS